MTILKAASGAEQVSDRAFRIVASEESADRMGDIVRVNGWQTENFMKNPVLLFGHKQRELPVGKVTGLSTRTKDGKKQLVADFEFVPEGVDEFADKVASLFRDKFLNASSVGFRPIKYEPIYVKDKDGYKRYVGMDFQEQELLELSIVPVPAHPNAVQSAKQYDLTDDDMSRIFVQPGAQAKSASRILRARMDLLKLRSA